MELHGHTKITLTDKAGNTKIHEEDNVITNLPQNILDHNFNGRLDYAELMPLTKMFNGCLLYKTEQDAATPEDTLLPSDAQVTAHAGAVAYSGIDNTCGNPVNSEGTTGRITNGYKFVFNWPESAGNGEINCVSLCHGDMGLTARVDKNKGQSGIKFKKLSSVYSVKGQQTSPLYRCQFFDWANNKAYWVNNMDGATRGIHEYNINLRSFGLYEDMIELDFVKTLTVDVAPTTGSYRDASYQMVNGYIYESAIDSTHTYVRVRRFRLTDGNYTEQTFGPIVNPDVPTSERALLRNVNPTQTNYDTVHIAAFPIIGNYLYVPNRNERQYIKIDLTTGTWGASSDASDFSFRDGQNYGGIVLHNGVYVGYNHMIINDEVIPITPFGHWDSNTSFCGGTEFGETGVVYIRSYGSSSSGGSVQTIETGIVMDSISTMNLLNSTIEKTPDQAMSLEYTLEYV